MANKDRKQDGVKQILNVPRVRNSYRKVPVANENGSRLLVTLSTILKKGELVGV
jgi:hypothetical protein